MKKYIITFGLLFCHFLFSMEDIFSGPSGPFLEKWSQMKNSPGNYEELFQFLIDSVNNGDLDLEIATQNSDNKELKELIDFFKVLIGKINEEIDLFYFAIDSERLKQVTDLSKRNILNVIFASCSCYLKFPSERTKVEVMVPNVFGFHIRFTRAEDIYSNEGWKSWGYDIDKIRPLKDFIVETCSSLSLVDPIKKIDWNMEEFNIDLMKIVDEKTQYNKYLSEEQIKLRVKGGIVLNGMGETQTRFNQESAFYWSIKDFISPLTLSIGCGIAPETELISDKIIYNDMEKRHLEIVYSKCGSKDNVFFKYGNFPDEIDFPDNIFSSIIISHVVHYMDAEKLDRAFAKMKSILKSGGVIFLQTMVYICNINSIVTLHDMPELKELAKKHDLKMFILDEGNQGRMKGENYRFGEIQIILQKRD